MKDNAMFISKTTDNPFYLVLTIQSTMTLSIINAL